MANQSPQLSPMLGGTHRLGARASLSPPPQLSKRDKRRTMLAERLAEMTSQFSANRDAHYREQLQAIQVDMNLIMEADTHGREPIPDSGDEIFALVQDCIQRSMMKPPGSAPPPRAGKIYADFAKEINDAMEERDAALTTNKRNFDARMSEIQTSDLYRRKLAASEHSALSNTLRDRLINALSAKKARLTRDKDAIEIGEGNAHLLHPSQYSLTNPSSPGGMHGKRATRNRRDLDDGTSSFADGKRKRKGHDSDESPAPSRQRIENGSSTPIWFAEKVADTARQIDAPLYSIDKLFTERELAMNYNVSALAAHSYMVRHLPYMGDDDSPSNGRSDFDSDSGKVNTAMDVDDDVDTPEAPSMERQYSHATRSTRGATNGGHLNGHHLNGNFSTGTGIDAFSDLNYPGNMMAITNQNPKMPPPLFASLSKGMKNDVVNHTAGMSPAEATDELNLIRKARAYNDEKGLGSNLELENGGKSLLEAVAPSRTMGGYGYFVKTDAYPSLLSGIRDDIGGEAMSKQSSQNASDTDGIPMSRQDTGEGATRKRFRNINALV